MSGAAFVAYGTPQYMRGEIGGLYTRPHDFAKGEGRRGHEHYIDHNTMLIAGDILIEWEDRRSGKTGAVHIEGPKKLGDLPMQIQVLAHVRHKITVESERAVWMCVFAAAEMEDELAGALYHQERTGG